ncbi:MAG: DotA/TraY family protein [Alphaproteobacteria bacterium]
MPRVVPRLKGLFSASFSYIALLMAHIYLMARLLPRHHPYLLSENMGRFGIANVIAEATRHLTFSRKNFDQILIYFALLSGVVMLLAQILILLYSVFVSPAMAFSWFDTVNAENDIAFNLLDQIFGLPGLFCSFDGTSCTAYSQDPNFDTVGGPDLPLPFHTALHGLFQFYSTGLLLIALLIFIYFLVVLLVETVTSGTPFGQRFQNVWAPVRLVVALGLLMPVPVVFTNLATGVAPGPSASGATSNVTGLNSGQYIVLYAAKYASSFATNGWNMFNAAVTGHDMFAATAPVVDPGYPVGERYSFLALPEAKSLSPLVEAMTVVHTCAYAYHRLHAGDTNQTLNNGTDYPDIDSDYTAPAYEGQYQIAPYWIKQPTTNMTNTVLVPGTGGSPDIEGDNSAFVWINNFDWASDFYNPTYAYAHHEAVGFYYGSDIIIRFGERRVDSGGNEMFPEDTAGVKPLCGDIRIPVRDLSDPGGMFVGRGGADYMLHYYYSAVLYMWFEDIDIRRFARGYVSSIVENDATKINDMCNGSDADGALVVGSGYPGLPASAAVCIAGDGIKPTISWRTRILRDYKATNKAHLLIAWEDHILNSDRINVDASIPELGWGGAGVWYNKIAEINGGFMDGVRGIPNLDRYPLVMEKVREFKMKHVENLDEKCTGFDPTVKAPSAEEAMKRIETGRDPKELDWIAEPLSGVHCFWNAIEKDSNDRKKITYNNVILNAMSMLVGADGLMSIRGANMHIHPLAQLVAVGKGLVDAAIIDMAGASVTAFFGGMIGALSKYSGGGLDAASQVFYSLAFMGITAGFVLFYVLPFMPFVYFFFAIASWVKAIFEAMVGVPLWALAHLRIDGDGLPGDAAQNGYFLILEIFIRPILTVVGLVAAVSIFAMQVRVLNLIWDVVVVNTAGYDAAVVNVLDVQTPDDEGFRRSIIDQFFFTVIYTIVCYMMAMASFKLIDKIPDNILRWAGAGVSSFGDIEQDNVESLNRYAAMGGMTIGNQAAGAMVEVSKGAGGALGGMLKGNTPPAK